MKIRLLSLAAAFRGFLPAAANAFWLLLLTAVCGVTSLRADLTIVQHSDGNMDTTHMFKDGRARYDSSGASLIVDFKSGEVIRLMRPPMSYVRFPSQAAQEAIKAIKEPLPVRALTLTPTGKKDTISGYAVDEYNVTVEGVKVTMWLAKAMPDYENIIKEMLAGSVPAPAKLGLDMAALPGFPMRISYEWPAGQVLASTVLSISSKPIADSEFAIPAGYKQEEFDPAILRPSEHR